MNIWWGWAIGVFSIGALVVILLGFMRESRRKRSKYKENKWL